MKAEGDDALAAAACAALAEITASLPERAQAHARHAALRAARVDSKPALAIDPGTMRRAMWDECALDITYCDSAGHETCRRIWL